MKKTLFAAQEHFFDNSKARFTANPKLALRAQTLDLRAFRSLRMVPRKNLNSRSDLLSPFFSNLLGREFHIDLVDPGVQSCPDVRLFNDAHYNHNLN